MYVRVAISKKANEIDFQDTNKMIDHLLIYNTTILLIVEDLVSLFGFWAEVWVWGLAERSSFHLMLGSHRLINGENS